VEVEQPHQTGTASSHGLLFWGFVCMVAIFGGNSSVLD
jgi:hypothetical protein